MSALEGKANPKDARGLLHLFCNLVSRDVRIPKRLLFHLRDAFQSYLKGERKLKVALGLIKGKRGRREAELSKRIEMAAKVMELLINGQAYKKAVANASEHFGKKSTVIKDAFNKHKTDAYLRWAYKRRQTMNPLTPTEKAIIKEIFEGKMPWEGPEISSDDPNALDTLWPGAEISRLGWNETFGGLVRREFPRKTRRNTA